MQTRAAFLPRPSSTVRMASAVSAARGKSQSAFAALAVVQESRAAAGLVSVSTTVPAGKTVVIHAAEVVLRIDPAQARVTRLRKGIGVGAKALHNMGSSRDNKCLVTLTYRGDNRNWKPEQISLYIRLVRKWYERLTGGEKLRYCWVAELQQRGVIHYHAVFWLKKGVTMPKADKRGWWPHGMSNTIKATAPIAYLMKYVSKTDSKNIGNFPHGARIFGLGGLDKAGRDCKRWVLWPAYVQGNAAAGDLWKPCEGGGYLNHETGQLLLAEFAPTGGGFSCFIRIRKTPRLIDASGPFSWAPNFQNSAAAGSAGYLH